MNENRAKAVEDIFLEAAELPTGQRTAVLERRCNGDAELVREVRSLLDHHRREDEPFLDPAEIRRLTLGAGRARLDEPTLPAGTRIGDYTIQGVLGTGGMGLVYRAEQERPRRTVALKLIRRGLHSSTLLRRFEHEAEILGRLQHPGIAQIFEAGLAPLDGVRHPFIAMELVHGPDLLTHVRQQNLPNRDRLALAARICDAVHHAHQRGIIHRDLKPANILVDPEGQPKILDFGVARMNDDATDHTTQHTGVGQMIGTLPYMSPEQVAGDPGQIDVRTDVYALGVIIFQLLTSRLPHELSRCSVPEAARVIRDEEPTRLSSIDRTLRGDVETIVGKALEKDRARRYQSAADLRDDLLRFLENLPIRAKQDSALYVIRKQLRRYRGAVAAAIAVLLALAAFAVYAAISASEFRDIARREHLARIQADRAQEVALASRDRADHAALELREELITSNIERGRLEGVAGNVALAEDFLWREHFRDPASAAPRWAIWELLHRNACLWTERFRGTPRDAAVDPTNTWLILAATRVRGIGVYALDTGHYQRRISTVPVVPVALTFDRTGQRIGWLGEDGIIYITHFDTGLTLPVVGLAPSRRAMRYGAIAWSPDGRSLAAGGDDGRIHLVDPGARRVLASWKAHGAALSALAYSSDSSLLASGSRQRGPDARVRLWCVPDGTLHQEIAKHTDTVAALTFTDGQSSLLTGGRDRLGMKFNLATNDSILLASATGGPVNAFAPAAGGRTLMAVGKDLIIVGNSNNSEVHRLRGHRGEIIDVFLVGSNRACSVGLDGTIRAWDLKKVPSMTGIGLTGWGFGARYSPDGTRLAVTTPGKIILADAQTRARVATIEVGDEIRARGLAYTKDGRTLLAGTADGTIRFIDPSSGDVRSTLLDTRSEIFSISVHPDQSRFATGHADGRIRIWSLEPPALVATLNRLDRRVEGVAFSPDGTLLASSGLNAGVQLWDAHTYTPLARLAGGRAWPVAFSRDGSMLLAGGAAGDVDVYDVAARSRRTLLPAHQHLIAALDFSPEGSIFATGSDDGTVRLWDTRTLRPLITFETFHGECSTLSFSPDGSRIACGAQNKFAPIWDLRTMDMAIASNTEYQRGRLAGRPAPDDPDELTPPGGAPAP